MRTLLCALAVVAAGCGRTALEPIDPQADAGARDRPMDLPAEQLDAPADMTPDLPMEHPPDLPPDAPPDMAPDLPRDRAPDLSPPVDGPGCVRKDEICNGVDDDCDDEIDEDQPQIPCPGGGSRFCVGGRYAECPRRCDVCVPGSKRTCITTYCTYWGNQTCADDGLSFGACQETQAPEVCRDIANRMMKSPDLEECCIKNGFCCVDEFDLDKDGDRTEMLGRCESVVCEP